jgi:hypothetical protein
MTLSTLIQVPRIGMVATVRNRPGVVAAVEHFNGNSERRHSYIVKRFNGSIVVCQFKLFPDQLHSSSEGNRIA